MSGGCVLYSSPAHEVIRMKDLIKKVRFWIGDYLVDNCNDYRTDIAWGTATVVDFSDPMGRNVVTEQEYQMAHYYVKGKMFTRVKIDGLTIETPHIPPAQWLRYLWSHLIGTARVMYGMWKKRLIAKVRGR